MPLDLICSASGKNNLNIGDLVVASIKFPKEQSHEVSILKRIKYPKNYIFAVYFHDQTGTKLGLFSNKGDKPLSVLPLKKGENFRSRAYQKAQETIIVYPEEINETLEKIYQVRLEDFNRYEGDRVTLVGYDNHEIELSDVDENNSGII